MREPDPNNPLFNILAGDAVAEGGEIGVRAHYAGMADPRRLWLHLHRDHQSPVTGPPSDLGRRLANAPAHTANLWTTYDLPLELEIGGGLNVVSSRFAASTRQSAASPF